MLSGTCYPFRTIRASTLLHCRNCDRIASMCLSIPRMNLSMELMETWTQIIKCSRPHTETGPVNMKYFICFSSNHGIFLKEKHSETNTPVSSTWFGCCIWAVSERKSYEDEVHNLLVFHREEIVKILLRERNCSGTRGFEEWVKGGERRLGLWLKISIIVARHLTELWEGKKEWLPWRKSLGHKISARNALLHKATSRESICKNSGLDGCERFTGKADAELKRLRNTACFCARWPKEWQ